MLENISITKQRLITKFITPQTGKEIITTRILPNISRSKGNQTMEFGQLIEHNMRKIFLEKLYTKCDEETSPGPFSKKSKLGISTRQQSKVLYSLFLLHVQVEGYRNVLKLSCGPLAFISYKTFLKKNKRSGTSLSVSFFTWFLKNYLYLTLYSVIWQKFIIWLPLLLEMLDNMCINCLLPRLRRQKFWKYPELSYQVVLPHDQKSQSKNLNIERSY